MTTPPVNEFTGDQSGGHRAHPRIPRERRPPDDMVARRTRAPSLVAAKQRPWRMWFTYPVLYALAGADAFGFWNTLSQIIKRDATLVLVFVLALAVGAVAVPHVAGQLLRSSIVGYGGSVTWIGVLTAVWLALGAVMCWLRWSTPTGATTQRSGILATQVTAAGSGSDDAMHIAVLLLVLFLLTGVLSMTHGYRFGDPRSPELRAALEQRARLERQLAEHRLSVAGVEGDLNKNLEDQQRAKRSRMYEHEIHQARTDELRNQSRAFIAEQIGDPEGTETLNEDYPPAPPAPRSQPDFRRYQQPKPDDEVI